MKRVHPDLIDMQRTRFINCTGKLRKFKRKWGITTVDGHEVFIGKVHYYKNPTEKEIEALKFLKADKDLLGQKMEGVESAWLFLNPHKLAEETFSLDKNLLQSNLHKAGVKYRSSRDSTFLQVAFISPNNGIVPGDITNKSLGYIRDHIRTLWSTGYRMSNDSSDGYFRLINLLAILNEDLQTTVHIVRQSSVLVPIPTGKFGAMNMVKFHTYEVLYEIKIPNRASWADTVRLIEEIHTKEKKSRNETDTIIMDALSKAYLFSADVSNDPEDMEDVPLQGVVNMYASDGTFQVTEVDLETFKYSQVTVEPSEHTYQGYVKTSLITDRSIPIEERLHLLFGCIDDDYKKKKKKTYWYHYLIAVVIIAVAIVLAVFTAGTSVYAGASTLAVMFTIAATITIAALYISLAMMAMSLLGAQQITGVMAQFMKNVEPLVTIASVVAVVGSFVTAIQRGAEAAGQEIAKQGLAEGSKQAIGIYAKEISIELGKHLLKQFTGIDVSQGFNFNNVMRSVEIGFEQYNKNQMRSLHRELRREEGLLAEMQEADERTKVSDVVKDFAAAQPQLLNADWSIYADIYDRPYEHWSTPFHTGCSQATTVNALWLQPT